MEDFGVALQGHGVSDRRQYGTEIIDIGDMSDRAPGGRPAARRTPSNRCRQERRRDRGQACRPGPGVVSSMKAPAGSSGLPAPPSVPSVSPATAAMPGAPRSARASARAYSWLGPPRPRPAMVTVNSPPDSTTARRPWAWRLAGDLGMGGGDLAGLALDAVAQEDALVAALRARRPRRRETRRPGGRRERTRCRRTRGPPGSAIRSPDRRAPGDPGSASASLNRADHRPGIGEGGRIGHGRARSDHGGIVAGHVGDRERRHLRRVGAARQPPALDAGEMLAHRVDVADAGARFEQGAVDGLLFGERQPGDRSDPVGRSAARHQHQHEIAGGRACGERERAFRPGKARRIGNGMAGLDDLDDPRRAAIAAPRHRDAGEARRRKSAVEVMGFRDLGHGAGGLSGSEDDRAGRSAARPADAGRGSSRDGRPRPRSDRARPGRRAIGLHEGPQRGSGAALSGTGRGLMARGFHRAYVGDATPGGPP